MAWSRCFPCRLLFLSRLATIALVCLASGLAHAKTPALSAIEIYPTGDAQAYVQIAGFSLNEKNEVHPCTAEQSINKNAYGKLPKIALAAGMSLERRKDGVIFLSYSGRTDCVVPGNLKLEKSDGASPAQLAEEAELQGQIVSASIVGTQTIPRLAPGVKIVLTASLDTELAEFLLAQSSSSVAGWQSYLAKYRAGPHSGEANAFLAILYVQDGQTALEAYQTSRSDAKLQAAKASLDAAIAVAPSSAATDALAKGIAGETRNLDTNGFAELTLYRDAFTRQTTGYSHLVNAEAIARFTLSLEPKSPEAALLSKTCTQERTLLDQRLVDFANKLSASRPDEAYVAIQPLLPFATEYPKVKQDLEAVYTYHVAAGKVAAAKGDPQTAVAEFQKAADVESTPEIAGLLQSTQQDAQQMNDKAAITTATTLSAGAEEDKDYIKAYQALDELTPSQRKIVADRLDSLKDRYVQAASLRAKDLGRISLPIRGIANESQAQQAYDLLRRCYTLTNEPSYEDRMISVGQGLSNYYLTQAKAYLGRPDGTGANLGWHYLDQALLYKGADAGAIRDEQTRAREAHQLRSKLSIRVDFRDRTSRREAINFAEQLTDSLAAGLESSGFNIKVVGPKETAAVKPNFFLVGDVLQNTISNSVQRIPKQSKYRSGEHEETNEAWNAADREFESAKDGLETARRAVEGAMARGKKKEIAEAKGQADVAQKKVDAARAKLGLLPKTNAVQVERDYTYTEQVNNLKATVELGFVIQDSSESVLVPNVPIPVTKEQPFTVLENVNAEDAMGVKVEGEVPSEQAFLEKVEYEARDLLLAESKSKVGTLPALVLQSADRKAAGADNDGAAESYMLYLNSTESQATPERKRAQKFLFDTYNIRDYGDLPKQESSTPLNEATMR